MTQRYKNINALAEYSYVAIDVETKGLRWWLPDEGIFGIAISVRDSQNQIQSLYVDIRENPEFVDWLMLQQPKKIVNHNVKFDLHMLWSNGVMFDPTICECTQIRACLIDEHLKSFSLDNIAKKYLSEQKESDIYKDLAVLYGGLATRNVQIKNLHKAPVDLVAKYAKKDTELALRLWEWQEGEIEKQELERIWRLEHELFPYIFDMERQGVRIDKKRAEEAVKEITVLINKEQTKLNTLAGFECSPNPSGDLQKLFQPYQKNGQWYACDDTPLPETPGGKPSLNADALRAMTHSAAAVILKLRKLHKTRDTFLKGHLLGHVTKDGYLHPNINQTKGDNGGTSTGRFSMSQPALQQIPARDKEVASIIRPLFLPDEGHVWCCWDYEQFEYRMFSHYVNDPNIIKIYKENPAFDYHQMVADLTGLPRNAPAAGGPNAKQLNLSMIYDMGGASIARTLGLPLDPDAYTFKGRDGKEVTYRKPGPEAVKIIEKYHAAIPGVRMLADQVKARAKSRGYIRSIAGRHMRYPNGYGLNKAKAILCQGSSADCMKQKIIEIGRYFKYEEPECRMYLSVHDEINLGVPKNHPRFDDVIKRITDILETFDGVNCPIKLKIPILTDFGKGANWAEASGKGV